MSFLNENSFCIDFDPVNKISLGFTYGNVFYNEKYHVNPFAFRQEKKPGTVYDGSAFRFNVNFNYFTNEFIKFYFGIRYIFKNLSYDSIVFF